MSHFETNLSQQWTLPADTRFSHQNCVDVEVIFGTPKRNCDGVGICRLIAVEFVRVRWKCPSARAWLFTGPTGTVCLRFDCQRLPQEYLERYFKDQIFRVEEDFPISKAMISTLKISPFTIVSGKYSVKVSEHFLEVAFSRC